MIVNSGIEPSFPDKIPFCNKQTREKIYLPYPKNPVETDKKKRISSPQISKFLLLPHLITIPFSIIRKKYRHQKVTHLVFRRTQLSVTAPKSIFMAKKRSLYGRCHANQSQEIFFQALSACDFQQREDKIQKTLPDSYITSWHLFASDATHLVHQQLRRQVISPYSEKIAGYTKSIPWRMQESGSYFAYHLFTNHQSHTPGHTSKQRNEYRLSLIRR